MDKVILYSTGCPKCRVLQAKLGQKKIEYEENTSIEEMEKLGIYTVPVLSIDGKLLQFVDAVKYLNGIEG